MGKSSGGVRALSSSKEGGVIELNERFAIREFSKIERGYGRSIDYSGHSTKQLERFRKIGKSYKEEEKYKAVEQYGKYASSNKEGAMSELIRAANRAAIARDLPKIEAELRKRKK